MSIFLRYTSKVRPLGRATVIVHLIILDRLVTNAAGVEATANPFLERQPVDL